MPSPLVQEPPGRDAGQAPYATGINWQYAYALGRALTSLIVAALLIAALLPRLAGVQPPFGSASQQPLEIAGKDLTLWNGKRDTTATTSLVITELAQNGQATATRQGTFQAADYAFLHYQLAGISPRMNVYLVWRRADMPQRPLFAPLAFQRDSAMTLFIGNHPEWRGKIIDIGFMVTGHLRNDAVIEHLTLRGYSTLGFLRSLWSQWTAQSLWTYAAVNHLLSPTEELLTSPTFISTIWVAMAVILLLLSHKIRPVGMFAVSLGTTVLLPWLVFDAVWQNKLSIQAGESRHLFAGKTTHEKRMMALDRTPYMLASDLKETVLPEEPSRIFLLHESVVHDFARLKTQYYLLPHNVYNFGSIPPEAQYYDGDFVVNFRTNPAVSYDEQSQSLAFGAGERLAADLVHEHPLAVSYRVRGDQRLTYLGSGKSD